MRETPKCFLNSTQHKSAHTLHERWSEQRCERGKINKVPTAARIVCGVSGIDGEDASFIEGELLKGNWILGIIDINT